MSLKDQGNFFEKVILELDFKDQEKLVKGRWGEMEEKFYFLESKICRGFVLVGSREILRNGVQVCVVGGQGMRVKSDV